MVEAAGVELFNPLILRKLLVSRWATQNCHFAGSAVQKRYKFLMRRSSLASCKSSAFRRREDTSHHAQMENNFRQPGCFKAEKRPLAGYKACLSTDVFSLCGNSVFACCCGYGPKLGGRLWLNVREPVMYVATKISAKGSQVPTGLLNIKKLFSIKGATRNASSPTTTSKKATAVCSGVVYAKRRK